MGLLSEWLKDEEFLVAAGLLTAGSQGQNIGQAAFPAILQAAKVKKAFGDTAKSTKSVWSIKDNKNVLASDKVIAENPDNYLPAKNTKDTKPTIGDEVLEVYKKLKVAKNDKEFKQILDGLSKPEQRLYYNKIVGNTDLIEAEVAEKISNQVELNVEQLTVVSEYKLTEKADQFGFESVADMVSSQMGDNPEASFQDVIEQLIQLGVISK